MFVNYSYEHVAGQGPEPGLQRSAGARRQSVPGRLAAHRRRAASGRSARSARATSTTPSTTRSSRRPARATRCRSTSPGLGGNTKFVNPRAEGDLVFPARRKRTSLGLPRRRPNTSGRTGSTHRAARSSRSCSSAASTASAASTSAPSVRAIRSSGVVLGGNKSLLFNAEYLIHIAGPVRLVLFYDAGQVRDTRRAVRVEGAHHRAASAGHAMLIRRFWTPILHLNPI